MVGALGCFAGQDRSVAWSRREDGGPCAAEGSAFPARSARLVARSQKEGEATEVSLCVLPASGCRLNRRRRSRAGSHVNRVGLLRSPDALGVAERLAPPREILLDRCRAPDRAARGYHERRAPPRPGQSADCGCRTTAQCDDADVSPRAKLCTSSVGVVAARRPGREWATRRTG